jgi:formylglycine-generating enzyme required for sulfatase activity
VRRVAVACALGACGGTHGTPLPSGARAQLSLAADVRMITIPPGKYIAGSTPEERGASYDDFLAATSTDTAREHAWFDHEEDRHQTTLPAFKIDLMPVTQGQFAEFVTAGKAPPPAIDEAAWKAQGFSQDFTTEVRRFVWKDGVPPDDRLDHPVVLVTWEEATRYCAWRGELRGQVRRLPTAPEFEKAARGDAGVAYPWGNAFEPSKLNSADAGPKDTVPVGTFTTGASPYGVLDMAGNVFQWTSTPADPGMMLVKGSAWEDHAGVGRAASGHARKISVRHVIVGFRCAGVP